MTRMKVEWFGSQAKAAAKAGVERGLGLAAEHVLESSRRQVPIEEGTLERSGSTSVDGDEAAVSYDTPYAVVQHEKLGQRHAAGRKAKYLEDPLNSESSTVAQIVAREIGREL